jgi:hypothetical protein
VQKPRPIPSKYEEAELQPGDTLDGWVVLGKSIASRPGQPIYCVSRWHDGRYQERKMEEPTR